MKALFLLGSCFAAATQPAVVEADKVDWVKLFVEPLKEVFMDIVSFLPNIIIAAIILLLGAFIGKILQAIVSAFLKGIGFNKFAEKAGITDVISVGEDKVDAHKWFGALTFWIVMLVSFIMSLNEIRLRFVSIGLDGLFHYIVTVFSALIIFLFGMFLSFISARFVKVTAQKTHAKNPDMLANITRGVVMIFASIACLVQIGMPPQILLIAVAIVFITLCITFILAFGIGGVAWAGKVLDKLIKE